MPRSFRAVRPPIYPPRYSNQSLNIFNLFQCPYLSRRRCWINLGRVAPAPRTPPPTPSCRKLNELSPSKCTFFTSELARPINESPVFFIEKAIARSVRLSVFAVIEQLIRHWCTKELIVNWICCIFTRPFVLESDLARSLRLCLILGRGVVCIVVWQGLARAAICPVGVMVAVTTAAHLLLERRCLLIN